MRSSVSRAVMSFVVLATARSSCAVRWKMTSPVAGSTRMAAGARTTGRPAAAGAGAGRGGGGDRGGRAPARREGDGDEDEHQREGARRAADGDDGHGDS